MIQTEKTSAPLANELARNAAQLRALDRAKFERPSRPVVITVSNQKGGVGKTTTTVNLAAGLALGGLRVVVIDIDPQGNASTALGIEHGVGTPSTYDVMVEGLPLAETLQECPDSPGLFVCPATIDLAGAEVELVDSVRREYLLSGAVADYLAQQPDVDIILIDCPPSLGLLTLNAFVAAEQVLIPIQAEYYALEGLSLLWSTIGRIQAHLNPKLSIRHILLTMVDGRTKLSAEVCQEVRSHFPEQVFEVEIPRTVRISEAPSYGQSVVAYDPRGTGAVAYRMAALELNKRLLQERGN